MDINTLKKTSQQSVGLDSIKEYPLAIREFYAQRKGNFDPEYNNRATDQELHHYRVVHYPVSDREFGGKFTPICNIFYNNPKKDDIDDVIERYILENRFVFHPIRSFERWDLLAARYYGEVKVEYYWLLFVFNRITDPFQALLDLNMIRIPDRDFINEIPYRTDYDFSGYID